MNTRSSDRRVRKTKKALRDSLATLLMQKNIRDISVQELAELADLNRATFYLHYRDVFDLQQQIEDEVVREMSAILDRHLPDESSGPSPLFVALLQYIQENAALCNMLLGENSNNTFLDKLCIIIEERCLRHWVLEHGITRPEEEVSYFNSYMVFGYVAVIAKWTRTGMKMPPQKLADLMGKMGLYGVGFLSDDPQPNNAICGGANE